MLWSSRSARDCAPTPSPATTSWMATTPRRWPGRGADRCSSLAEPDSGRSVRVRRHAVPAPAQRARGAKRDPRPRALGSWSTASAGPIESCWSTRSIRNPGIPSRSRSASSTPSPTEGLRVTSTAINDGAEACPYGSGMHPYLTLGTEAVDTLLLHAPGRTVLHTDDRGIPVSTAPVEGTDYDFRKREADRSDKARSRLHRSRTRRRRARPRRPSASGARNHALASGSRRATRICSSSPEIRSRTSTGEASPWSR